MLKVIKNKNVYVDDVVYKNVFNEDESNLEEFIDEDDIVFYEIVMSARNTMDAYLITGNIRHYPIRNFVVTPKEMLDIINGKRWL